MVAEALERDLPQAAESQPEMIEPIYPLRPPQADPEAAEGQPEMIAQHYTVAEMPERAIPFWLRAGEHSRGRLALLEAIGHFERGLIMARALPASPQRSRWMLALLLALGDARQMTSGQLGDALATYIEAAAIARAEGAAADLAHAATGAHLTEAWIGTGRRESLQLLEAALCGLGAADSGDRARVLAGLGSSLIGRDSERGDDLLAEAIAVARRCGDKHAYYFALSRQIIGSVGRPCPATLFPERRRALDEERALLEGFDALQTGLRYGFAATSAYLEMGDYEGFSASLAEFNEYASKRRISSFGYGLASAEAMRAILVGEFAEAERLANQALEIGREVQGEIAPGVYGVQMFSIRREQGRLAEVAPVLKRFIDDNPRDAAWRPGLAIIASDLGFADAARKAFAEMAASGFDFAPDAYADPVVSGRGLHPPRRRARG
jgi:hypothetical protein